MIARIRRWIRSRVHAPEYDAAKDPVVRELRTIRRESIDATRASNTAMREARSNRVELAYLRRREASDG